MPPERTGLLAELRRRRVFRVAGVYAVVAWAVIQVATSTFPYLHLPDWIVTAVIVLALLGFPAVLALAWAFDLTPGGLLRTPDAGPHAAQARLGARVLLAATFGVVLLVGGFVAARREGLLPSWMAALSGRPAVDDDPALRSIAVLPFSNLSADQATEYFSDGITDEILATLSKVSDLKVISRTSVMQYKATTKVVPQIAAELGVGAVLEGSVQKEGDRVRITVQLINARSDKHLWAETYDRTLEDVFGVETEVAEKIASSLRAQLSPEEHERMTRRPTRSIAAQELYRKGHETWQQETEESLHQAIDLYQAALREDPEFALAYVGLSAAYADLGGYSNRAEAMSQARAAARKALELDSTVAGAHDALAFVLHNIDFDLPAAEREYETELRLNPGTSLAYFDYARLLVDEEKEPRRAVALMRRAGDLDPLVPWIRNGLADVFIDTGHPDSAIAELRPLLALAPEEAHYHHSLGMAYRRTGRLALSAAELERAVALDREAKTSYRIDLGITYAQMGRRADAERIAAEFAGQDVTAQCSLAQLLGWLGRNDEAFAWLERALADRNSGVLRLRFDPDFEPLRKDPRFAALVRNVGA